MTRLRAVAPVLAERARADQIATLYERYNHTTLSMLLGSLILCGVMHDDASPTLMGGWLALVLANQVWRGLLARTWRRVQPGMAAAARWGRYWALGSTLAGALWGFAAVAMFPSTQASQALMIVCLFGVVLGGLNLTAVYKPSFYGFVLPALLPLIARVAIEGDPVHWHIALVMAVVLGFILAFGHRLNDVLTHALATRYENSDLIVELKEQTRAAQCARTAAESANRAKSQLLAAASHDLRQPLHALALFTAALDARTRGGDLAPLVANVERATASLDAQFDQLLDLSRLEANAFTPERQRVALASLFARLHEEFESQAVARGLRLRFAATTLAVESDPALLARILRNLIGNALRYTRTGGVIVGARRLGNAVGIDVSDSGPGISARDRDRIFDEFFQITALAHASCRGRGSGLGLAIVKRFATLLGHQVEVASLPGRGARFRIVCHRAGGRSNAGARVIRGDARRTPAASLAGALVAVIDDDETAIEGMRALFGAWGARVAGGIHAAAVLDALGSLESYPDLIVADLRLADGDSGVGAVARLREELGTAIPALIVSGDTGVDANHEVRAAGLQLLQKPVNATALRVAATAFVAQAAIAAGVEQH